jgi:Uma2 family endonuclease
MGMTASIPYYTVDDLYEFPRDGNRYELLDGVLLVTPAPGVQHENVVSRVALALGNAVQASGHARVYTHGAVSFPPGTQLEPDILVVPAAASTSEKWNEVRDYWLAVEVYSRSSRMYDRNFKCENYLRLGVEEVWLVDRIERTVEVSRRNGENEVVTDALVWRPPTLDLEVRLDLNAMFGDP